MLPKALTAGNFDRFNLQDVVIERFRRFATEKRVSALSILWALSVSCALLCCVTCVSVLQCEGPVLAHFGT